MLRNVENDGEAEIRIGRKLVHRQERRRLDLVLLRITRLRREQNQRSKRDKGQSEPSHCFKMAFTSALRTLVSVTPTYFWMMFWFLSITNIVGMAVRPPKAMMTS